MTSIGKRRNKHHVPSAILFFKIILGKTLEDGKLKLPNNFTRKYGGGLSNPMFLNPPDGTEWKLCWTKHDDEILLEKGWKEFATYYCLDHGHLVLFEYKKSSHFLVHIFEISGLEIDYPLNDNLDYISDETVEILEGMPPSQKAKLKSPMLDSPQPSKKLRIGTSGDARTSYNLQDLPQLDQINGKRSKGTNLHKSTFASYNEKLDEDIGGITQCPKVEQPTKLTEALNRARTLRSRNPSFMVVLTLSYANKHSVSIPSKFAKEYLKEKQGATLLQVQDGRTWSAIYNLGNIYSGWKRFASDNNLKAGDICVFELTDLKGLSFKVSTSRAAKEPNCSQSQETVQEDRVKLLDTVRVQYVESKADITSRKATKKTSLVISPDSGTNGAMIEAEKFTSENPFFIFSIRPNFLGPWRPVVPMAFIRKYLGKKTQILTLQFGNKLWRVKLLCYAYNTPSKLSDGWFLFVRETELQAGDVCIFELINREGAGFDVHIFRCHY